MCTGCNVARDFFKVKLHGFSVGMRQGKASSFPLSRTDRAEQVSIGITLISRLAGPCCASGPLPNDAVLLTNTSLVLKPDFNGGLRRQVVQMSFQCLAEVFLKAAIVSVS